MFMGELSIFGAYGVKKVIRNRTATKTAEQGGQPDLLMSPGTTAAVNRSFSRTATHFFSLSPQHATSVDQH